MIEPILWPTGMLLIHSLHGTCYTTDVEMEHYNYNIMS